MVNPQSTQHVAEAPSMGQFGVEPAAVFSPLDWRIWVVDRKDAESDWRLRRIHPFTGVVESYKALPSLESFTELWLTGFSDGRIAIAGNVAGENRHVIAILSSLPFAAPPVLDVSAKLELPGQLLGSPQIARGVITALIHPELGNVAASPQATAYTASDLGEAWTALADDLDSRDQPLG